jgi:DnaK suppressor protein
MPAKKKTATKKTAQASPPRKIGRPRKSATPVEGDNSGEKSVAAKKSASAPKNKGSTKKTAERASPRRAAKKVPAQPAPRPLLVDKDESRLSTLKADLPEKPVNPEAEQKLKKLAKRPKHTPAVFKLPSKKATPILFTLQDVREVLKKRRPEDTEAAATEKPGTKSVKMESKKAATPVAPPAPPVLAPAEPVKRVLGKASLNDILGLAAPANVAKQENAIPPKWRKYHKILTELRAHVLQELDQHTRETLKRSPDQDGGDSNKISSHMGDNGTDAFDRDFALNMVSTEQEALAEIEAAIRRIHKGTYGICEITGQKISAERLEAVPFTRFSIQGQAEHEKTKKRKLSRAGGIFDTGDDNTFTSGDDDE